MSNLKEVQSIGQLLAMVSNEADRAIMEELFDRVSEKLFEEEQRLKRYKFQYSRLGESVRNFQVANQVKDDSELGSLCWNIRNYIGWVEKGGQSDLEVHIGKDTDYKSGEEQYKDKLTRILQQIENLKTKKGGAK